METCCICSAKAFVGWYHGNQLFGIPKPPADLIGSLLCRNCYYDNGPALESKIREALGQPTNKTEGLHCNECNLFYSCVEPNKGSKYICYNCR